MLFKKGTETRKGTGDLVNFKKTCIVEESRGHIQSLNTLLITVFQTKAL